VVDTIFISQKSTAAKLHFGGGAFTDFTYLGSSPLVIDQLFKGLVVIEIGLIHL